jgi:hypothetical protein
VKSLVLLLLILPLVCAGNVWAHGTQVIPQIFDGAGVGRTKLDLSNVSGFESITQIEIRFFLQNGLPWSVETNQGTASIFNLSIGPLQTLRLETAGTSQELTVGYAEVRNSEGTTTFPEDFDLGITVFYEILNGNDVVDTVSVPLGPPTVIWLFPVEVDLSQDLFTGLAVVDRSGIVNRIDFTLYAFDTTSAMPPPPDAGTVSITLQPNEQIAKFLIDDDLFPGLSQFKGLLFCQSEGPVSFLALLQTPSSTGVQYATLTPVYWDALRRNSSIYLREGFPLDADLLRSDYFVQEDDALPWDVRLLAQDSQNRGLVPQSGARLAIVGVRDANQFDALSIVTLRALSFSNATIDLSDGSDNLTGGFAFAILTGLGRYAKVRISDIISDGEATHLGLEVFVYN